MDESPDVLTRGAKLATLFNDARITNALMVILCLVSFGGAEALQSTVCSL